MNVEEALAFYDELLGADTPCDPPFISPGVPNPSCVRKPDNPRGMLPDPFAAFGGFTTFIVVVGVAWYLARQRR